MDSRRADIASARLTTRTTLEKSIRKSSGKTASLFALLLAATSIQCEAGLVRGQFQGAGTSSSSSSPVVSSTISGSIKISERAGKLLEVTIAKTTTDSTGTLSVATEHYFLSDRSFGGTTGSTLTELGVTTQSLRSVGGLLKASVRRAGPGRLVLTLTKPDDYVSSTYSETGSEVVKIRIDLRRNRTSYSLSRGFRGSDGSYGTTVQTATGLATGRID